MKNFGSYLLFIFLMGFVACVHNVSVPRLPSSETTGLQLSALEVQNLGPKGLMQFLKSNCCAPVVIEELKPDGLYSEGELDLLEAELGSDTPVSPVMTINSSHHCSAQPSTVRNEIKNLKLALRRGFYPSAQCSTYDLGEL
jgi:hypothetical protein